MTAALVNRSEDLLIHTRLFGEIRVPPAMLFSFPRGLPGFEKATSFALLPAAKADFFWLQSVDEVGLCFLMVDTSLLIADPDSRMPGTLAIVTVPEGDRPATANLRAPVLIDRTAGVGAQLIVGDEELSTAHPFNLAGLLQ